MKGNTNRLDHTQDRRIESEGEKGRLLGQPSTIRPNDLDHYFGVKASTFYNWVNTGKLRIGHHYYKCGSRILLIDFKNIENFLKGRE